MQCLCNHNRLGQRAMKHKFRECSKRATPVFACVLSCLCCLCFVTNQHQLSCCCLVSFHLCLWSSVQNPVRI